MHGNCRALLAAVMLCALVGCEKEAPTLAGTGPEGTPDQATNRPVDAEDIDLEALLAAFRETFEGDFEVLGAQLALRDFTSITQRYCLISVRPRRAGLFVIGHEFVCAPGKPGGEEKRWVISPPNRPAVDEEIWAVEYDLCIGNAGDPRYCRFLRYAWPLANVGDTVVVPIAASPWLSEHRFFRGTPDADLQETAAEMLRRAQDEGLDGDGETVALENEAQDNLRLISATVSTATHGYERKLLIHTFTAVFEAIQTGEFSVLLTAADRSQVPLSSISRVVPEFTPVVVVPKDRAVTVLANQYHGTRAKTTDPTNSQRSFSGGYYLSSGAVVLREGDRLETEWDYDSREVRIHPELVLLSRPFEPTIHGAFDEVILSPNRGGP